MTGKLVREKVEREEEERLAPYAIHSRDSRGRAWPEKEHEARTAFQRDRDRIIHSTAFRRLQYKTQVFVNHEGDHYRTRLTHTLETCQIARTIGRALGLNEDLIEAISLAHDLGHGPFGHAGEWALSEIMKGHGGFEHNIQSLRIVEALEESYPEFSGLNLTYEVREGLKKHPEKFRGTSERRFRSAEAEVVDLSDEIAYSCHDLDDGLRAQMIPEEELEKLTFWKEMQAYIRNKYPRINETHKNRLAIRLLINRLVMDLVKATRQHLKKLGVKSAKDIQKVKGPLVLFSPPLAKRKVELRRFLHTHLYQHYRVVRMTEKGKRFIQRVFQAYLEKPGQLPSPVRKRVEKDGLYRAICDYISGMTDRYVQNEYKRLFEPYERV
ncbi:MAG: deoxyguanosinetriphosphate triphosphohydrolase [Candidatus Omnitrophica bacterium]|nr:deoxyguanosinetriphosphate triphosphohydrolase [Candidatus Omnitrophota bacterium]